MNRADSGRTGIVTQASVQAALPPEEPPAVRDMARAPARSRLVDPRTDGRGAGTNRAVGEDLRDDEGLVLVVLLLERRDQSQYRGCVAHVEPPSRFLQRLTTGQHK